MPTKCNSCGATYQRIQRDGSLYFHECSPEVITPAVIDRKTGEVQTEETRNPRTNTRNENLKSSQDGKTHVITSEGYGTTEV